MDEQTMFELLEVYDAMNDLREVEEMLVGESIGVGPGEGIMGNLSYVSQIISRYSPLYMPDVDYDKTYYCRVLEDEEMDNHRKARILLGIAE